MRHSPHAATHLTMFIRYGWYFRSLKHWVLHDANCSVHAVHCMLFAAPCSVHTVQCMLFPLGCSLHAVFGMLFSALCSLLAPHCMLFAACCYLHDVHFWLFTAHCSLHSVHCMPVMSGKSSFQLFPDCFSHLFCKLGWEPCFFFFVQFPIPKYGSSVFYSHPKYQNCEALFFHSHSQSKPHKKVLFQIFVVFCCLLNQLLVTGIRFTSNMMNVGNWARFSG